MVNSIGCGIGCTGHRRWSAARVGGIALAAMLVVAQPAAGQRRGVAAPKRPAARAVDAANLDVAGVRLGMTAERAVAAAGAASDRCERGYGAATFEERVAAEVARRKGRPPVVFGPQSGIGQVNCRGPVGESLRLDFASAPEGSVVKELVLVAEAGCVDVPALRRQAVAKYGEPTSASPDRDLWCRPEAGPPTPLFWCARGAPFLRVDTTGRNFTMTLEDGEAADTARDAAVAREAARRAPASDHAAF